MIERLALPDVLLATSTVHRDARGAFAETYRASALVAAGVAAPAVVQENLVRTARAGVLRGLHFQLPPFAQAKLVQVVAGALFDVAVDIRPASPTLGRWVGVTLSAETPRQLFVPAGFAHGYLTLTDDCSVLYKTSAYYAPEAERGLCWNDPALAIDWPMESVAANARDESWPSFAEAIVELDRRG
ncbi:MAG: dTDP-4-dehydrorhamnose 3,5-epimerase [Caulobacteraceae bacterium]